MDPRNIGPTKMMIDHITRTIMTGQNTVGRDITIRKEINHISTRTRREVISHISIRTRRVAISRITPNQLIEEEITRNMRRGHILEEPRGDREDHRGRRIFKRSCIL